MVCLLVWVVWGTRGVDFVNVFLVVLLQVTLLVFGRSGLNGANAGRHSDSNIVLAPVHTGETWGLRVALGLQ